AKDERLHLRRRRLQPASQVAAETGRIELRPQTDDALPRQTAALHRQIRQHIHRVADDDEIGVLLQPRRLYLIENTQKQIDITVDEVKTAFVRFTAQAGRDNDNVTGGNIAVIAGINALVAGDEAGAVEQVGRHALCDILVRVDDAQATDDASALKRVGCH